MQQYIAQFKMLFNREDGRHMDTNDGKETLKVMYFLRLIILARSKIADAHSSLIH